MLRPLCLHGIGVGEILSGDMASHKPEFAGLLVGGFASNGYGVDSLIDCGERLVFLASNFGRCLSDLRFSLRSRLFNLIS